MAFTFKELKQAKENIMKAFGLDGPQASKVVGYYNGVGGDPETVNALISGDLSAVPAALSALGFVYTKETTAETPGAPTDPTAEKITADNTPETPTDNIIDNTADVADGFWGGLPVGLYDDICSIIDGFANKNNIADPHKMDPRQFASALMLVGESIKKRKILQDTNRIHEGGFRYDGKKVLALLTLWDFVCGEYRQIAFTHNVHKFCGFTREYLHDYDGRLTSGRSQILKKAKEIETASIMQAIASGGNATVANIFLGKSVAGLQETVTVQHVTATAAPTATALPVFDSYSQKLTDSGGEQRAKSS